MTRMKKGMSFVTTIRKTIIFFTHRQIQCAKDARRAYNMGGTPSPKYFKNMVRRQSSKNYHITNENILIADKSVGPDVSSSYLKKRPSRVQLKQRLKDTTSTTAATE